MTALGGGGIVSTLGGGGAVGATSTTAGGSSPPTPTCRGPTSTPTNAYADWAASVRLPAPTSASAPTSNVARFGRLVLNLIVHLLLLWSTRTALFWSAALSGPSPLRASSAQSTRRSDEGSRLPVSWAIV